MSMRRVRVAIHALSRVREQGCAETSCVTFILRGGSSPGSADGPATSHNRSSRVLLSPPTRWWLFRSLALPPIRKFCCQPLLLPSVLVGFQHDCIVLAEERLMQGGSCPEGRAPPAPRKAVAPACLVGSLTCGRAAPAPVGFTIDVRRLAFWLCTRPSCSYAFPQSCAAAVTRRTTMYHAQQCHQ